MLQPSAVHTRTYISCEPAHTDEGGNEAKYVLQIS